MVRTHVPDLAGSSYEDHTADLWLLGSGGSPEAVIVQMVNGLYGAVAERFEIGEGAEKRFVLEAGSLDLILVDIISEALYLLEAEGKLLLDLRADLLEETPFRLEVLALERPFEIPSGAEGLEIKAVAYHGAYLKERGGSWEGRVLLDI